MTTTGRSFLLVLVFLPPLLFFWQRGLNEPDEGRYVEIAREMMAGGDWLVPRIKGVPHYAKPPITYWAIAVSMNVFGVNEFAARLPGTLAALFVLLLVFDLGRVLGGSRERGLRAALALGAMLEFMAIARIVTTDMLLCLFTTAAFWAHVRAEADASRRRLFHLLMFAALGLGFMTKGLVPLAVFGSGLLTRAILARDFGLFRQRSWLIGCGIVLLIGLPWFLVVAARDPELYRFFLGGEVIDRVASGRGRAKPFYYFLVVLPLGMLPLTPLVLKYALALARSKEPALRALLFGFLLGPFLVFSLSASKLWTYILPVLPIAALIVGAGGPARVGRGLIALWLLGLMLGLGLDFVAESRAADLGNNVGYRDLARALPAHDYRGVTIPSAITPVSAPPVFAPGPGPRIATYRLRFTAAAFHLLGEKPQYLPTYGGDSLWEIESRARDEYLPDRFDLARAMAEPAPMIVLLKSRDLNELEQACGRKLLILGSFGRDRDHVVACSNY